MFDRIYRALLPAGLSAGLCGMVLCGCGSREAAAEPEAVAAYEEILPVSIASTVSAEDEMESEEEPEESAAGDLDEEAQPLPSPESEETIEEEPDINVPKTNQNIMPETLRFVDAWGEWFEADIDTEVPGHAYDWQCLENTQAGISYEGDESYYIRKGIDVSHHQGSIDWSRVKEAGYDFAMLRIGYRGYSEGKLQVDSRFHENIRGAKDAGLEVGVYFFSQAVDEAEALEEARLVLDNLAGYELELPVAYDPELIRDAQARTDEVTGEQFTKNTIAFCEEIRKAGYQPMIYGNMYWEAFLFDMKALEAYHFWYADYEQAPQTPYGFAFWQHSASGQVDGIQGNTDLNIQFCPRD